MCKETQKRHRRSGIRGHGTEGWGGRISKGNGPRACSCAQGALFQCAGSPCSRNCKPPRESNSGEEFRSCHHARLGVSECPRTETRGRSGRLDAGHVLNCAWAQRGAAVAKRAPFRDQCLLWKKNLWIRHSLGAGVLSRSTRTATHRTLRACFNSFHPHRDANNTTPTLLGVYSDPRLLVGETNSASAAGGAAPLTVGSLGKKPNTHAFCGVFQGTHTAAGLC